MTYEIGASIDGATITQNHAFSPNDLEVGASVDNAYDHAEPCA